MNDALDQFGNTEETTDIGRLLDARVQKDLEKTSLTSNFSRQVIPSSLGQQNTRSALSLRANHRFSQRLTGHLGAGYTRNERQGVTQLAGTNDRQQFNAGWKWRVDEFWTLGVDYNYRHRKTEQSSDSASSNAVLFSLRYDGEKRAVSR